MSCAVSSSNNVDPDLPVLNCITLVVEDAIELPENKIMDIANIVTL